MTRAATSHGGARMARGMAYVLAEDAALAHAIPPADRELATRTLTAPELRLSVGAHEPATFAALERHLGLLVMEGRLLRELTIAGRACAELLDSSSLVRLWDDSGQQAPMPYDTCWRVLEPVRLAILDDRFLATIAHWPELVRALLERQVERSQRLALSVAIHSLEHVELRLVVLLWHLADRFGKVTSEGTVVPIRLTEAELGKLIGAQRASVSRAIRLLAERDEARREADRTWVLLGDPRVAMRDLRRRRV